MIEPNLIRKVALSVVVAVVVFLGCVLLGVLLIAANVPIASAVGDFLKTYSTAFGILAGIWYFFTH